MGTWGTRNFENDGSLDWVFEMIDAKDGGLIADTLQFSLNKDGLLDTSECEDALAAAETVAALTGKPSEDYPETPLEKLDSLNILATLALRKLAVSVVEKIKQNSEMKQTFTESGEEGAWFAVQDELIRRLS